jgi:hypothetical protein
MYTVPVPGKKYTYIEKEKTLHRKQNRNIIIQISITINIEDSTLLKNQISHMKLNIIIQISKVVCSRLS